MGLTARACLLHEHAQGGNIRRVRAEPGNIHRQAEHFRLLDGQARVIQLAHAEARSGLHSLMRGGCYRARRTIPLPARVHRLEELMPVAFRPHIRLLPTVQR